MLRSIPAAMKRCSTAAEIGLLVLALLTGMIFSAESRAQGPGLTTISDTVYRADGSAASGTETITGAKQFAVPPALPSPSGANDAANKGYVDAAVVNIGSGSYVSKAGDTMTGPLSLPGDPVAPNQASDRHYVDSGLAAKADLIQGTVPTGELGSGVAGAGTCSTGNSTWSVCGGSPVGITFATTALNWTQKISSPLTGGLQATVTLTPCPMGIDTTSSLGYQVLLSGGGNREAVNVLTTPGACTSGASSGTITFTPFYSYAAGYTVGSASSGIQETLNAGCGADPTPWKNSQCNVTIPANGPSSSINTYNVYGTIYLHSNQSVLNGYGTTLNCLGRGACLQIGDLKNSNDFSSNTVTGLTFRSPVNLASNAAFAGVAITQTQKASQVVRITTATPHGFRVGDMVTILFTDSASYWGDAIVTKVPSSTRFQYAHAGGDIAAQSTPGVVALAYVAILDNAMNTHLVDISLDLAGENGRFNNFFDLWDDENVTIDHFNNQAGSLNNNVNWTGSFVFSAGNQSSQIAPVITLRDSTITANYSNGVTVYNSNGLYIENTVLQATGPWQVYSSNTTGNYQGAYLKNIYAESTIGANPLSPARSPFPGLGIAGLIAGASSAAAGFQIAGNGGTQGAFQTGGTGSTRYSYFIVANDTTAGTQTSPMQVLNWLSSGRDSIAVRWPRVANGTDTITYDVLRMATPVGLGGVYPYSGGCPGGSGGTCGYVAKGLSQSAACSGGLVCAYTDSGSASTSAYTIRVGNYSGNLIFWPGSIVSVNKSVLVTADEANPVGVGLGASPLQVASQCSNYGATSSGGYTSCLSSTSYANSGVANQTGTIITDGNVAGGGMTLTKGRLNFSSGAATSIAAHHIITLIDSQPGLTQSTSGFRPPANANDTWIGTDVSSAGVGLNQGQLAFGAPVAITNYIAQTGDGVHANWLERLSASLKEFNIPAKFDQNVILAGLSNGCLNIASGVIASTGSPCGSGTKATTQSAGDNSAKLATTAYVRNEIQMAWSCPVAGTTSTLQYCNWTLPAAITITGFDLAASTAAAGCTTYPTLQIWDGTANAEVGSYSITFTSGTNFFTQVTGSANVPPGHFLRLKITTAGAGCSTNAGGVVGTIAYQMQN